MLQQQDRGVKTTSLNVMVGAVTIVTESSARLGFGTELSAAVGLQVSNDGATWAMVTQPDIPLQPWEQQHEEWVHHKPNSTFKYYG